MCCIIYKIYGVVAVHPYRHLIEVLLSARIQSKRVIVRVTWACSSTARWACELRSRRPANMFLPPAKSTSSSPAIGTPDGSTTRVSICHKSTRLWQCHTFWIATVHSRTSEFWTQPHVLFAIFEHVTSALIDLHWLPIAARIEFKICVLAYKSLNSTAPAYISDMLQPVSTLQRK